MDPVRLALVGAGTIGRVHLAAIAAEPEAQLVAVADPSEDARVQGQALGVPVFDDAESMLQEARPDGVVIATPTAHHVEPALAAMEAGADLLLEKPIAADLDGARQIAGAARSLGRKVLIGHHRRHNPAVHRAREIVQGGTLGRLVGVNAHWTLAKPDAYFAADWRRQRAAGPVLTNLIHEIDLLRFICGEIVSVSAETANAVRGHPKEDAAAVLFRFAGDALGTALISDAAPSPWAWEFVSRENPAFPYAGQNTWRIVGSEGALEFPRLTLWTHAADPRDWHHPMEARAIETGTVDVYARQCAHFCAVVRGTEEPVVDADDGMRSLAATLAVFQSMEDGRRITL